MRNFKKQKTDIQGLAIKPFTLDDTDFLISLLSNSEIQPHLFRSRTTIRKEKIQSIHEKMYIGEKLKDITYIISYKGKNIGYTKAKLFDENNKSCYTSIALLPDTEFRGKGFAQQAYLAFHTVLLNLGYSKLYARVYESNAPSLFLHLRTGYVPVGRQHQFLNTGKTTTADAVFMEKVQQRKAHKSDFMRDMYTYIKQYITRRISRLQLEERLSKLYSTHNPIETQTVNSLINGRKISPVYNFVPSKTILSRLKKQFPLPKKYELLLQYNITSDLQFIYRWGQFYTAQSNGLEFAGLPILTSQISTEISNAKTYVKAKLHQSEQYTKFPGDCPELEKVVLALFLKQDNLFSPAALQAIYSSR